MMRSPALLALASLSLCLPLVLWAGEDDTRSMARVESTPKTGERWAIVVGVEDYDDKNIDDLSFANDDAKGMYNELIAGGWPRDHVVLLTSDQKDPSNRSTRNAVLGRLHDLEQLDHADTVLFYFSGHGLATDLDGPNPRNFLAPMDVLLSAPEDTGIEVGRVVEILSKVPADRRLLIFDACRNKVQAGAKGTSDPWGDERYTLARGTQMLFATRAGEVSYEDDELRHGQFTAFLLQGMAGEADGFDGPPDGIVDTHELYAYVRDRLHTRGMQSGHMQSPWQKGEWEGEGFALVRARSSKRTPQPVVAAPTGAPAPRSSQDVIPAPKSIAAVPELVRAWVSARPDDWSVAADRLKALSVPRSDRAEQAWWVAQSLKNAGRLDEAASAYTRIIAEKGAQHAPEARLELALVRERALVGLGDGWADPGEDGAPSAAGQAFLDAARALDANPPTEVALARRVMAEQPRLLWRQSAILLHAGAADEARARAEALLATHPDPDLLIAGADIILDALGASHAYDAQVEAVQRFSAMDLGNYGEATRARWAGVEDDAAYASVTEKARSLGDADAARALLDWAEGHEASAHVAEARYSALYHLEQAGLLSEASALVDRLLEGEEGRVESSHMAEAQYRALNHLEQAGLLNEASAMVDRMLESGVDASASAHILFRQGRIRLQMLDFEGALASWATLGTRFPTDIDAPQAWFDTASLRGSLGQTRAAAEGLERYATLFPLEQDAERVYFSAGVVWHRLGPAEEQAFYERYLSVWNATEPRHQIEVLYHLARLAEDRKDAKASENAWKAVAHAWETAPHDDPRVAHYAAEGAFRALQRERDAMRSGWPAGLNEEQVTRIVQEEKQKLEALIVDALALVDTYKDFDYASASLTVLGEAHFTYADLVYHVPCPSRFSDFQCDALTDALDKIRMPIEEKGRARLVSVLQIAAEEHRWSSWQDRALEILGAHDPANYPGWKPHRPALAPASMLSTRGDAERLRALREQGDPKAALATARTVLARNGRSAPVLAQVLLALLDAGQPELAKILLDAEPDVEKSPDLLYARGEVLRRLDVMREAQGAWRDALALDPKHLPSLVALSTYLSEIHQDAEAADLLARVVSQRTSDPDVQLAHGVALLMAGRRAEAETTLREAARLAPIDPEPHWNLALLYSGAPDALASAKTELDTYVQLGGTDAQEARDRLKLITAALERERRRAESQKRDQERARLQQQDQGTQPSGQAP